MTQTSHQPIDIAEVRRRLRLTIESVRREAAAHRAEAAAAEAGLERLLEHVAVPLFRQFTSALRAEGHLFRVQTPAHSVRIEAERSGEDYLELALDTSRRPVAVVLRRGYTRGNHVFADEQVIAEGGDLSGVSPAGLLEALLQMVPPFVGR
jgi:hypothetical protein